jgi:hypothetical protein
MDQQTGSGQGHYELTVEAPIGVRVAVAFGELAAAI